ncbi:M protein [Xinzhou nematode virus 6]|uniref:M protein n=1 Tax=Xinzhou nematode virus 6 TaxID=1923774 RepID=A0A1L3KJ43_9NIDO|nr:M protein [Xinzhou nematode virus 6]APG77349.1 M protein [Xinzhou nematode virus 6]
MDYANSILESGHDYIKRLVLSSLQMDSVLHWLAIFLVVFFILDVVRSFLPYLNSFFLFRKILNCANIVKLLFFFIIFFLQDSTIATDRSSTQKITLAVFSILVIATIVYVLFYVLTSIYMLFKYRSFKIALAGPKVLIVDGKCFTLDRFECAPVFIKSICHGEEVFHYGEHQLDKAPTVVVYRSAFYAIDYKFFSAFEHDNQKAIVFRPSATKQSV